MSAPASKRQRTSPSYELLYHPGIPGRGEYIRLAFEAAGTPYTDVANDSRNGYSQVQKVMSLKTGDSDGNPPIFAPPALRVPEEGKDGKTLLISQTPNILLYLGPKLGLVPEDEVGRLHVNQLTLTALDLSNEAHDVHHPVGVSLYYEDQKEEAIRKAQDVRENRLPKFLGHFEGVLKGNEEEGKGKYLVGEKLTYADTTLWQVVDGFYFAFPKEMAHLAKSGKYPLVFDSFYPNIKEKLTEYLESERRLEYSMGIYRHYPELDRQ
ncbi:hypothetical protein MMC08_008344 [Hypocenomyce scalaris]|nr:hypothetical protein [Hypocenomyce scalaris]